MFPMFLSKRLSEWCGQCSFPPCLFSACHFHQSAHPIKLFAISTNLQHPLLQRVSFAWCNHGGKFNRWEWWGSFRVLKSKYIILNHSIYCSFIVHLVFILLLFISCLFSFAHDQTIKANAMSSYVVLESKFVLQIYKQNKQVQC